MLSFRNSENTRESVGMKRVNGERKEGRKKSDGLSGLSSRKRADFGRDGVRD